MGGDAGSETETRVTFKDLPCIVSLLQTKLTSPKFTTFMCRWGKLQIQALQCIVLSVSILQGEGRDLQTIPVLDGNTDCSYYSPVLRELQV